jgi:DNA-binding MarR family transcriptional regulator
MQGQKLDRERLFDHLWELAQGHRQHLVEVYQTGLAKDLKVTNSTLSGAMRDLTGTGRIKKIKSLKNNVGVYLVRGPH